MNQKEQARLKVLNSLWAEQMTVDQAAALMGVSARHTRRILAAYRREGVAALAHGHRGRRPPNATPEATRAEVLHLASTRYCGTNHTHLSELLGEREGIDIDRSTLRRILVSAGLNSPRRRRPPKHRVRRQRMPQAGMLIQMDGSYHRWLGEVQFTLLLAVDDATGTVANALFCEQEDSLHLFPADRKTWCRAYGIPVSPSTSTGTPSSGTHPESGLAGTATQFSRAMEELGIRMIFALSPHKPRAAWSGLAGTFQDRLVTELRLAGASSIGEANGVLKQFLPRYNPGASGFPRNALSPSYRPLGSGSVPGAGPVLQARQEGGQRQYGEVPAAYPAVVARAGTTQLCRRALWRSWKDWTAIGSGCAMRDASSMPGRRRPARHSCATGHGSYRPLLLPAPFRGLTTGQALGRRHSSPWTRARMCRGNRA